VRVRLEQAFADGLVVGLPAIVLYELWYGINKSARPHENAEMLATFLALDVTPWPFEGEDAEEAGEIRAVMERAGTPIGPYDVLVAAQARRREAILVTANTREFARVPGLRAQDWAR
jgi:tRNA(fMet)-specific endonuclease VapC